jgi:hypothetical protein
VSANASDIILPTGQRLRYEPRSAGIFAVKVAETQPLAGAAAPYYSFVNDFELIEPTTAIRAKSRLTFGAVYVISSDDFDDFIPMTMVTRFPPGGVITDDGETVAFDRIPCDVANGQTSFQCYSFDHAWEMVPGAWHLELWFEEQIVADHVFTVTVS